MSAAQRPFLTASNRCEPPGQTVALDEARSNELETLVSITPNALNSAWKE